MTARTGALLMVLSVLCNGMGYHTLKMALRGGTPATLAACSGVSAVVTFLCLGAIWRWAGWSFGGFHRLTVTALLQWLRQRLGVVSLAALLGGAGGVLLGTSVDHFGPEVTSFLANQTLVFLVLGGVMMGERVRASEAGVIVLILAGGLLFSYEGGQFQWAALGLMALACLGITGKQLTIRHAAKATSLPIVMAGMQLGMAISSVLIAAATGTLMMPTPASLLWAVATALIVSVAGMTLLYAGYGAIGVSRGAPMDAMRPLAVLMIGLMLGMPMPSGVQIAGAVLILGGSAALARLHRSGRENRQAPAQADEAVDEPVDPAADAPLAADRLAQR